MLYQIRNKDGITRYVTTSNDIANEYTKFVREKEGYAEKWAGEKLICIAKRNEIIRKEQKK